MSENYDDLADLCGPKEFYDLDGDGHIGDFEAAMMLSDVDDELSEIEQDSGDFHTVSSVSASKDNSKAPPPPATNTQGSGCLTEICVIFGLSIIVWVIFKLLGWE